jgi:hypothetical protein
VTKAYRSLKSENYRELCFSERAHVQNSSVYPLSFPSGYLFVTIRSHVAASIPCEENCIHYCFVAGEPLWYNKCISQSVSQSQYMFIKDKATCFGCTRIAVIRPELRDKKCVFDNYKQVIAVNLQEYKGYTYNRCITPVECVLKV